MAEIRLSGRRGCGFRKPGGVYAVARVGAPGAPDSRPVPHFLLEPMVPLLAFEEATGVKISSRGMTLVPHGDEALLVDWVGAVYYPTPGHFLAEVAQMGLSRRVPKNVALQAAKFRKVTLLAVHPLAGVAPDDLEDALASVQTAWRLEGLEGIFPHHDECARWGYPCANGHQAAHDGAPHPHQCANLVWLMPQGVEAPGWGLGGAPWTFGGYQRFPALFWAKGIDRLEVVTWPTGEGEAEAEEFLRQTDGSFPVVKVVEDVVD